MDAAARITGAFWQLQLIFCLWVIVTQIVAQAQDPYYGQSPQYYPVQPRQYFCTGQNKNYDCIFRNVDVKYGPVIPTFGNPQITQYRKSVSIVDSRMDYLPKSLMDVFPNIETLDATALQIRSLQPEAFQYSANLKKVYLADNLIEQISWNSFQGATNIATIVLDGNRINSIDQGSLSGLQNLRSFYISFNEIPSLPMFSDSKFLAIVNASHNFLTQIDNYHFSENSKLRELDLSFNRLGIFDMQQLDSKTQLKTVEISSNYLSELYIPTHVKEIIARNNSIEQLFTNERMCSVKYLNLAQNKLRQQPDLRICRSLQNLDLSYNLLQSFNFDSLQSMYYLTHLNLRSNHLHQIDLPAQLQYPLSIKYLDLSSNMLSSVPNTNVLRNLGELYLHVNKLENFDFLNKPNLYYLTLAFNQWDCDALNTVVSLNVLDRQQEQCSDGLHNHGICCQSKVEQDSQSFHKFKDLIWEAYNFKLQNKIFIDNNCRPPIRDPLTTNQMNDKLATISNIEASKEPILQEISQVKEEFNRLNDQIVASQYETQTKTNQTSLLAKEIDRWRSIYGVEKEGFVEAGEVLRRVVQFLDSRKENSVNLLKRREEEVSTSQGLERSKQNLVNTTKEDLETLKQIEKNFKQKEQSLRTQMNFLLAQVNKNSASLKGS